MRPTKPLAEPLRKDLQPDEMPAIRLRGLRMENISGNSKSGISSAERLDVVDCGGAAADALAVEALLLLALAASGGGGTPISEDIAERQSQDSEAMPAPYIQPAVRRLPIYCKPSAFLLMPARGTQPRQFNILETHTPVSSSCFGPVFVTATNLFNARCCYGSNRKSLFLHLCMCFLLCVFVRFA